MNEKAAGLACAPVLALALALALGGLAGAPARALAQPGLADARACTAIAADAERLACYDRALRGGHGADPRPERGGSATPPEPAQAREVPRREPAAAATAQRASVAAASAATAATAARAATAATAAAAQGAPAHRERSKGRADGNGDLEITVVEIRRRSGLRETDFVTDDGRIWRQTDSKHVVFPATPFRAVISSGSLGSHFLSPPGERISVRVAEQRR